MKINKIKPNKLKKGNNNKNPTFLNKTVYDIG